MVEDEKKMVYDGVLESNKGTTSCRPEFRQLVPAASEDSMIWTTRREGDT